MKALFPHTLLILILAPSVNVVRAQGYLGIGSDYDFEGVTPFKVSLETEFGYDRIHYKDPAVSNSNEDSTYLRAGIGAVYGWADKRTQANIGADFSVIHYLDSRPGNDTNYNARLGFNVAHQVNPRLTISDSAYVTYEIDPDFNIGASASSRQGQYFYGYNSASATYAWTQRFSTTVGYTISGIHYNDSREENRLSHLVSLQGSYAVNPRLSLVGEYRFGYTDFNTGNRDNHSHYALVGLEYAWSQQTSMSLRAGAEYRHDDYNDNVGPYLEVGVRHVVSDRTALRWYGTAGYDNSELGTNFDRRYSMRTGITATQVVTDRLSLNAGLHYTHSMFKGNGSDRDVDENTFNAQIGLAYRLWKNVNLTANYGYTILTSGDKAREYDRNNVSAGLQATF